MAENPPLQKPSPNDASEMPREKKKRLLGFPSVIWNQVQILNESAYFKENYGQDDFQILLIAIDDNRAAILTSKNGTVEVDQVKNKPEEINPLKKQIRARIVTDTETFLGFAMKKVKPAKAIFSGKLKIAGVKTVLRFTKYFGVIAHERKSRASGAQ